MRKYKNIISIPNTLVFNTLLIVAVLVILWPALLVIFNHKVYSAPYVSNRSLKISSSNPGEPNVSYEFSFEAPNLPTFGSVKLSLCSNSPLPEVVCSGFNGVGLTSSVLSNQTGTSGFSVSGSPTQTEIILARSPSPQNNNMVSFTLNNISNPNDVGTYYGRIELFSSNNATGPAMYVGGLAISINNPIGITTEVPPYLYFCSAIQINGLDCLNTSRSFEDLGELRSNATKTAQSQFLAATNASSGYNISYTGNVLTSGNNIIESAGILSTSQIGKSQFGINLRRNNSLNIGSDPVGTAPIPNITTNYNTPDRYSYKTGDVLVTINEPSYFNKFTVSYIVNIDKNQKPGLYSTTFTYLCLANF
jgi:hypothetical protein